MASSPLLATDPAPLGDGGPSKPDPERVTATGESRWRARGHGVRAAVSPGCAGVYWRPLAEGSVSFARSLWTSA
jgi:hypothetical protein